ncbi:ATP-binding protein [Streptomyces sp. NPDC046862]|uniref:ATP-binding protein n=1 Tax=Streptomyces sp. NPDC046862 TaxID=3154603 RepID=UPI0034531722
MPGEPSWDDDQSWDDDRARDHSPEHAYPGTPGHRRRSEVFGLPATPASVGQARENVREVLDAWGADRELCGDAVLVVSELVTNALTHTGSDRVVCRLGLDGVRLRVEVEDQNRGRSFPERRQPDADDQNGRGLMLVCALSTDWGAGPSTHGSGSVVWAELTWQAAGPAPGAAGSPSREADSPAPKPERPVRPAESAAGADAPTQHAAGARAPGTGLLGRQAASSRESGPPVGTVCPVPGAATASPDGGVPGLAVALTVPAARRPAVTSSHVTRPVSRSAEGHLPHGTPAHP